MASAPITARCSRNRRTTSGMSFAISTTIRFGSTARARAKSKTANPAMRSAPCAMSSTRAKRIRQTLLALSDVDRSQTYGFCGAPPMPVRDYRATLRIVPVIDGGRGRGHFGTNRPQDRNRSGARHHRVARGASLRRRLCRALYRAAEPAAYRSAGESRLDRRLRLGISRPARWELMLIGFYVVSYAAWTSSRKRRTSPCRLSASAARRGSWLRSRCGPRSRRG